MCVVAVNDGGMEIAERVAAPYIQSAAGMKDTQVDEELIEMYGKALVFVCIFLQAPQEWCRVL